MLALATVMTLLIATQTSQYSNACSDSFEQLFGASAGTARLHNEAEFVTQALQMVTSYYGLNNASLTKFWHLRDPLTGAVEAPTLALVAYRDLGRWDYRTGQYAVPPSLDTVTSFFTLSPDDPLGPLSINATNKANLAILQSLSSAELTIRFVSLNVGPLGAVPYVWTVRAHFAFVPGGGQCVFRLRSSKTIAPTQGARWSALLLTLASLLLAAALTSIVLSARAVHRSYRNST